MRTLRATFQGRIAKYFTFRVQPDLTGTGTTIADAWFDIGFSDAFHLRFGRDKVPVGLEVLLQDSNVVFLERGLTVNLLPQRDIGVQAYGNLPGGLVSYAVGVFDGQVDGSSNSANNPDADNSKDVIGRVVVRPFNGLRGSPVERLTVGIGGTEGRQRNAGLPVFKTSVQQTYFAYANDATSNGPRMRVAPQASYYFSTLGAYAEYARSKQRVTRGSTTADVNNKAWQFVGSLLLTGETAGERIRPKRAFDPEHHHWGAVQLTARYGTLSVDPLAFALGLTDPAAHERVRVVTGGANWYFTTNVKAQFNVERSVFDHDPNGSRHVEHAALIRMQLNY
jgi:phosphate-selective porin OprO/OprP